MVWGGAGYVLFPEDSAIHQSFLTITIVGIATAAVGTLTPYLAALNSFILITIPPILFKYVTMENSIGQLMSFALAIYTSVLLIGSRRFHDYLSENTILRIVARQREMLIQENEKRYRLLYEKSEDAMLLVSNYQVTMANLAAINMLGYESENEIIGTSTWDHMPLSQKNGVSSEYKVKLIKHDLKMSGFGRFEWICKRKDGEIFPVEMAVTLVTLNNQQSLFCVIRDISRTKKIQHQLIKAQRKADAANKAKSDFLANISHEIRTPMHAVIGLTKVLLLNPLSKTQFERGKSIKSNAELTLSILNDILDLSKIEAGKLELRKQNFNLKSLMDSLGDSLHSRFNAKKLFLNINSSEEINHSFLGDYNRIRQVLNNLIDNAYKYTDSGGITVNCNIIELDEFYSNIQFEVIDTGIGINKQDTNKLFLRFSQVDDSNTKKYKGVGLGLSICKQLINLMDGEISFTSEPGKGTDFKFNIKLENAQTISDEDSREFLSLESIEKINARALVVDDIETNQYVTKEMLEIFGVEVVTVGSGSKAIEKLQNEDFDIVFMDCQMPDMDGFETTKRIRTLSEHQKHIPIIALTANALSETSDQCIRSGMNDYMSKPINFELLQKVLHQYVNNQDTNKLTSLPKPNKLSLITNKYPIKKYFNFSTLYKRLGGNLDVIHKIINQIKYSMKSHIQDISDSFARSEISNVIKISHKLKGSAANLSCENLSELAHRIETSLKDGNIDDASEMIKDLYPCYDNTISQIEKIMSSK